MVVGVFEGGFCGLIGREGLVFSGKSEGEVEEEKGMGRSFEEIFVARRPVGGVCCMRLQIDNSIPVAHLSPISTLASPSLVLIC